VPSPSAFLGACSVAWRLGSGVETVEGKEKGLRVRRMVRECEEEEKDGLEIKSEKSNSEKIKKEGE
jgi:hypothetical protein